MLIHLEKHEDFEKILKENKEVLVDFFATWCGPCKMLTPELEDMCDEHSEVMVVKVDVDQFNELAADFHITAVPTMVVFKDNKQVGIRSGYMDKDAVYNFIKSSN